MVMMEEFRRRRNLKSYYEQMKQQKHKEAMARGQKSEVLDFADEVINREMQY